MHMWTNENREIIHTVANNSDPLERKLLKLYSSPTSTDAVITQQSVGVALNRHNYVHKMHKLLQIEQLTRERIISSFNLKTEIELVEKIYEEGAVNLGMIFARQGELFARVPLNEQLSEDSDAGKLILTSVKMVLVAPQNSSSKKVYEANIVDKDTFGYDGRGRDYIYLVLSPRCCAELDLESGDKMDIEIQFQMDRLFFCRMHFALDQLSDTSVVFPDVSKINPAWTEKHTLELKSDILNDNQLGILRHIVAERSGYTPPFIIYGPFGTGKTETLAQAAMVLAEQKPTARILICTHSNSAADLYITKHMDQFIKNRCTSIRMLRIYFAFRRVSTISPTVLHYCKLAGDKQRILDPTAEEISKCQIVITTLSTSLVLGELSSKGSFTHIFLDEAAQALECETIMPLTLTSETTCVVMAGDHRQMSSKVYSVEAKSQRFHRSFLERLYRHYATYYRHNDSEHPLSMLLRYNYRSKMEIVRFLSAVYYGGPDMLEACSDQPTVDGIVPLTLYVAQGCEVQQQDSTSYYNTAEVEEITARITELVEHWPEEWGPCLPETIAVVTPYADQVSQLRSSLRRRGREYRKVVVDRVSNVPGREFRAVFLSVVRTRHLAEQSPTLKTDNSECDGDNSDFGFLSDQNLLNTALTRAQSMVAVVGDPVALCAIGECMNVWRTFLKHCQNMESIHPGNVTLERVKGEVSGNNSQPLEVVGRGSETQLQVTSLMGSAQGKNLIRLAELSQEAQNRDPITPQPAQTVQQPNVWKTKGAPKMTHQSQSAAPQQVTKPKENDCPFDFNIGKGGFLDNWSLDYRIEPDTIIMQLAGDSQRTGSKKVKGKLSSMQPSPTKSGTANTLMLECVKVKEKEGHAVVYYNTEPRQKKRQLLGANDYQQEFDSDVDCSDGENPIDNVYTDYSAKQLLDFLQNQPEQYKRCILHTENSQNMYARIISSHQNMQDIKLSSRLRCGRGFNGDEVVVELISCIEEDVEAQDEKEGFMIHGQVVGILKRAINPRYRMFVCTAEHDNTGLMVPLNRGIPKIFNLETKTRMQRSKKGHVCVYTFTKDKDIDFHHYEPIDPADPDSKLFILRYLKWDANFYSPLGIVVGVLPVGKTVDAGMDILNVEYYIPKQFKTTTLDEVEKLYPSTYKLPRSATNNRRDLRDDTFIFSIDPETSDDIDDALSVKILAGNQFEIGIHITDVSQFVKKTGDIDSEAHQRGCSYYPMAQASIPMLPERLSSDLCSLKEGQDRLALTLFVFVNSQGQVINTQIERSIMRSKKQLSYKKVEEILNGHVEENEDLMVALFLLQKLATIWRRQRLGNSGLHQPLDPVAAESPKAHMLVEEMMIQANHQIALQLVGHYPESVPLRRQMPPNELKLDEWRQLHAHSARQTTALSHAFLHHSKVCLCASPSVCRCINVSSTPSSTHVSVWRACIKKLETALQDKDIDVIHRLAINPEGQPGLAVAQIQLWTLQERSQYICSGDVPEDEQRHSSLHLMAYTHFTSPIRRYMDLVVHRMLHAMIDKQSCPYSQFEISALALHCSDICTKASSYEQGSRRLHLAVLMQDHPGILYPAVEQVDDQKISLCFPGLSEIPASSRTISLGLLNVAAKPQISPDNHQMTLTWQKRIYDLKLMPSLKQTSQAGVDLNPSQYVVNFNSVDWQTLLAAVMTHDRQKILSAATNVFQTISDPSIDINYVNDVTSEGRNFDYTSHHCTFRLTLHPATVLKVHVTSELYKGLLTPTLQLIEPGPNLSFCLKHQSDPVGCFASVTTLQASKSNYRDLSAYRAAWLPLMDIEAAHCAVHSGDSIIIRGVTLTWKQSFVNGKTIYLADFSLPHGYCKKRCIKFSGKIKTENDMGSDEEEKENMPDDVTFFDYLCVRYVNLPLPSPDKALACEFDISEGLGKGAWVAHCLITGGSINKNTGTQTVRLKLHHSSMAIPQNLLYKDGKLYPATVELITKTLPNRRMEDTMRHLRPEKKLISHIALGTNPDSLAPTYMTEVKKVLANMIVPGLPSANNEQETAIRQAMCQPFSLIQGPPGTGKTLTGVRLAYLFTQLNRKLNKEQYHHNGIGPQVLYCGPSNKSVDVVAGYFLSLGHECPRLVRVYSQRIVREEFPVPSDISLLNNKQHLPYSVPENMQQVALHHRIRAIGNGFSSSITGMDRLIKGDPDAIPAEDLEDYMDKIQAAEAEELERSEIVLATCTVTASRKMILSTNTLQLIIDEAGMCTEPESIVPIYNSGAQQVTLLGDQCQLRPVVLQDRARRLGLDKSLFERYSGRAYMLTKQYRMHEAIADFPSQNFYRYRLECGKDDQTKSSPLKFWPNGRSKPIMFVHVIGHEEAQSVATEDGGEQSKSNLVEAGLAVRGATLLVRRHHIKGKDVVVMSQYRAQCAEMERQLSQKGETDVKVSTVVESQGSEWDYVIISTVRSIPKSEIEAHPTRGWRHRNLGFITDENQINVAITRARKGLIIIGNKYLLSCDPMWDKLLKHYDKHQKIITSSQFMSTK